MSKKLIKRGVRVDKYCTVDLSYKTIDEAIKYLQFLKEEYKGKKNLRIDADFDYDGEKHLVLTHDRKETDEEYQKRLKK